MTFEQYMHEAFIYMYQNPGQRRGQAYFNFLALRLPRVAELAVGKKFDPFFNDDRIDEFLDFVSEHL